MKQELSLRLREMYTEILRRLRDADLEENVRGGIVERMEQLRTNLISAGIVQPA